MAARVSVSRPSVRNKQVHIVSHPLEVAIVAVWIAAEGNADILELHAIGNGRYAAVHDLRCDDAYSASVVDLPDLVCTRHNIAGGEGDLTQVTIRAVGIAEQCLDETGGGGKVSIAGRPEDRQRARTVFKE